MKTKNANGRMGRPVGFDKEAALEAAMLLFWEHGFEGTSMADLTQAMGINASSVYAAFKDKQSLFELVVKRYLETRGQYATEALQEPTWERVVRALFANTVAFLSSPGHPPSCMTLVDAMGCGAEGIQARDFMKGVRVQNEAEIRQRLIVAQEAGDFPKDQDPEDYTRYLSMLLAGLSIQAANGSTEAELKRTAHMALQHLGYCSSEA
ncbi:MAG: TetR/AcrR family transcriptional regulator [Cytophagaceae bacterium]|nr:MAG: TetR/AcrR family transcriptional regulator [Cytophagaceae bacterium]